MPDKGRIDISKYTAQSPKPGEERSYNAPNGTPTKLKAQYEKNHEKWVCDGKVVRVINDTRRTYEEVPIPADQQGANMIDGPLPFLLGMPPDKAKARYRFKLLNRTKDGRCDLDRSETPARHGCAPSGFGPTFCSTSKPICPKK